MSATDLMLEQRFADARAWLHEFLPDGDGGYVQLALARGDEWSELKPFRADRHPFDGMVEGHSQMLDAIGASVVTSADQGYDVFACPYLHEGRRRQSGRAAARRHVHADIDGPLDLDKVSELGAMAVASGGLTAEGSPRGHVYVRLAESVTAREHQALCRALGQWVGGQDHDTSKTLDNDLLRPAGTLNHKSGEEPRRVAWLVRPDDPAVRTWAPDDLARRLGMTWPVPARALGLPASAPNADELDQIDIDLTPRIAGAVRKVAEAPQQTGNNELNKMSGVVGALTRDAPPEVQQASREALVQAYLGRGSHHTRAEAQATVDSGVKFGRSDPAAALGPAPTFRCDHSPPCPSPGKHDRLMWREDDRWAISVVEGLADDGRRFHETDLSEAAELPPARYFDLGDGRKVVRPGDLVFLHGMNAAGKSPTLDLLGLEHLREDPDCLWVLFDYELGKSRQRRRLLDAGLTLEQIRQSVYYVDHPSLLTDRAKDVLVHGVMDKAERWGKVPRLMTWDTYSRSCSQMPGADPEKNAYINAWFTTHPDWAKTMFEEVTGEPLTQYVTDHPNRDDDITPGGGHAKQDRVVTDVWLRRGASFGVAHELGRSDYLIAKNGHGDYSIGDHVATLRNRIVGGVSRFYIAPHRHDPTALKLDLTKSGRDSAADIEMAIIAKLREAAGVGLKRTEITGSGGAAPACREVLDKAVADGMVAERQEPRGKRYWLPGHCPS